MTDKPKKTGAKPLRGAPAQDTSRNAITWGTSSAKLSDIAARIRREGRRS